MKKISLIVIATALFLSSYHHPTAKLQRLNETELAETSGGWAKLFCKTCNVGTDGSIECTNCTIVP
jgi:hypothetical protein